MPRSRPRVKTVIMILWSDPEIKATCEIVAIQDRRSLTNLVEVLLVNHCKMSVPCPILRRKPVNEKIRETPESLFNAGV